MIFATVVLAAGKSERMDRNKLLLEVAGHSILDRVLNAIYKSSVDEVIVVLGHRPEELRSMVEAHGATVVINQNYDHGMLSSLKVGLRRTSADGVFLVLGDQIGLKPALLNRMATVMETDLEALIVSPAYKDRKGHPVLFRRSLFPEILNLSPAKTMREIVYRNKNNHRLVESDRWCLFDIDILEDFEQARRFFEEQEQKE